MKTSRPRRFFSRALLTRFYLSAAKSLSLPSFAICVFAATTVASCSSQPSDFEIRKAEREEMIARQEMEKERQEREKQDIKRQRYWNDQLKRYE